MMLSLRRKSLGALGISVKIFFWPSQKKLCIFFSRFVAAFAVVEKFWRIE